MNEKIKILTILILTLMISSATCQAIGDWAIFGIVFGTLFVISIGLYVSYCIIIIYLLITCPMYYLWCNAMSTENLF